MPNSYGNSGNRWWVGLNTQSSQSTVFGTGSILSPNGYESLPSGNASDDTQFAAAARKNAGSKSPVIISVENVNWYNINGPYASQSAANAAIPAIQKAHPAPGEVQQVTAGDQGSAAQGGGVNPTGFEQGISSFISDLTNANLWIRAAKIGVGGAILIVGLAKLTGSDQKLGKAVSAGVKAAPLL